MHSRSTRSHYISDMINKTVRNYRTHGIIDCMTQATLVELGVDVDGLIARVDAERENLGYQMEDVNS